MVIPHRARSLWLLLVALAPIVLGGCQFAASGQNLQGVRYYQSGQYYAALQQFQKAVASDPANADAYYNMASTFHRMGTQQADEVLLRQSETLYNQCLDIESNHVDCHRGLAVLLVETGREDRAFKLLKNWALRSPQVADSRIELGRLYQEFGQLETAQLHLQQALQVDQSNARAWAALGQLRERAGEYDQALANYQRSYTLNNFQPGVAQRIATLNRSLSGGGTTAPGTRTVGTGVSPRY